MDHAYIEENQVVDRYLMEKLSAAEAASFEGHYLHCRQCLEQLELAETFLHDFRRSAAREAARAAAAGLGILGWLGRRRAAGIAVVAAAVLAAVGLLAGFERRWAEERRARGELAEKLARAHRPQINTLVLPLRQERGAAGASAAPSRQLRPGPSPEWIVLSLELGDSRPAGPYRVTLIDGNGEELWHSEGFAPDARGSLSLSLHSSWLAPGDYRIRAEAVGSSGTPTREESFSFRVLPSSQGRSSR